jgi:Cu2+-exporting ATPase
MTAVAVLIVTCPCALSLATPAAMLTMSGKLARSGILVRRMQALEALTNVDTVVFDKTGTLTLDRMEVSAITTNKSITETQALQLASAMAKHSLHPVSRAIVEAASSVEVSASVKNVQEISGAGLLADSGYGKLKFGSSRFCGLEKVEVENIKGTIVHLTSDKAWLASFEVLESIKDDAAFSVSEVTQNNIQVEVLSGDKISAVQRVADAVGIKRVYGDCTPQDKLAHIQDLKRQGRRILMVGDGLNDGPVLASAHVSIAMGQAVPLAQSQSDFVVMQGQLAMVPYLLEQAKRTMKIVKQNLVWAATYNAICVPLAVAGYLPAWLAGLGMALSSLFVILNAARLAQVDVIKGLVV